jgi:hypothetical protein
MHGTNYEPMFQLEQWIERTRIPDFDKALAEAAAPPPPLPSDNVTLPPLTDKQAVMTKPLDAPGFTQVGQAAPPVQPPEPPPVTEEDRLGGPVLPDDEIPF